MEYRSSRDSCESMSRSRQREKTTDLGDLQNRHIRLVILAEEIEEQLGALHAPQNVIEDNMWCLNIDLLALLWFRVKSSRFQSLPDSFHKCLSRDLGHVEGYLIRLEDLLRLEQARKCLSARIERVGLDP